MTRLCSAAGLAHGTALAAALLAGGLIVWGGCRPPPEGGRGSNFGVAAGPSGSPAQPAGLPTEGNARGAIPAGIAPGAGEHSDPSLDALRDELRGGAIAEVRLRALRAIVGAAPDDARRVLADALRTDPAAAVRADAAKGLVALGGDRGLPALLEAAEAEEDVEVRGAILLALAWSGRTEGLARVLVAARGRDRDGALAALRDAVNPEPTPALLAAAAAAHDPELRGAALAALGRSMRRGAARPAIERALAARDAGTQGAAARALADLRDPAAIPALEAGLELHPADEVAAAICDALDRLYAELAPRGAPAPRTPSLARPAGRAAPR